MPTNIIVLNLCQNNMIFALRIVSFILPLAIAVSDISLLFTIHIFIGMSIIVYYLKNKHVGIISNGIPIAKVCWTQHWENETILFIAAFSRQNCIFKKIYHFVVSVQGLLELLVVLGQSQSCLNI